MTDPEPVVAISDPAGEPLDEHQIVIAELSRPRRDALQQVLAGAMARARIAAARPYRREAT